MYTKIIRKSNKNYKYYYHNIKVNNKVKNIYLGSSKKEALIKLSKLKANKTRGGVNYSILKKINLNKNKSSFNELLMNAPSPYYSKTLNSTNNLIPGPNPIGNKLWLFLVILILLIGIGVLSYFSENFSITGLVVYSENKITLDVNKLVSKEAKIFVNVAEQEESKSITEFNLALINKILIMERW